MKRKKLKHKIKQLKAARRAEEDKNIRKDMNKLLHKLKKAMHRKNKWRSLRTYGGVLNSIETETETGSSNNSKLNMWDLITFDLG